MPHPASPGNRRERPTRGATASEENWPYGLRLYACDRTGVKASYRAIQDVTEGGYVEPFEM